MSHEAEEHAKEEKSPSKKGGLNYGKILLIIAIIGILIWIFSPEINDAIASLKERKKAKEELSKDPNNTTAVSTTGGYYDHAFLISGTLPDTYRYFEIGNLTFDCDEDYEIIDGNGNPYYGKAHHDTNIGKESTCDGNSKRTLKFRTMNGKEAIMRVSVTPWTQQQIDDFNQKREQGGSII